MHEELPLETLNEALDIVLGELEDMVELGSGSKAEKAELARQAILNWMADDDLVASGA